MSLDRLMSALADRYTIERELGAGGMATVYLAEDVKHHRKVAIKVLRPELAAVIGAERFLAEIRTTANLQHPHILALIDSGDTDGLLWYVMPYVEGESLRDRITHEKQLPVADAVRIATEVAGALDYAHRHQVIHRDIKPENILLHDGSAMVADFGIALAASSGAGTRMTETGMSLGTPHYMSPEQAMGEREITARTDVYALGCVTYEMLVGEPPFSGATAQAIVARVLTEQPRSLTAQRRTIPVNVDAAVHTALEKIPADRFASAGEFAAALGNRNFTPVTAGQPVPVPGWSRFRDPPVIGIAAIAVVAIGAVAALLRSKRADAPIPPISYILATTDSTRAAANFPWPAAISPDGGTVVYTVAPTVGAASLYYQRTNETTPHLIPGTAGAYQPYFSPDGQWLAFEMNGKERKVRLDGSAPVVIADGDAGNGAAWTIGNQIVFGASGAFAGISHVSAAGGTPVALTHVDSAHGERDHDFPIGTPDGKAVIFSIWSGSLASAQLGIASTSNGKVTRLGIDGIRPLAVLDGELVYVKADGTVMAVGLDVGARRTRGSPVPVHDPVVVSAALNGNSEVYISQGGAWIGSTGSDVGRLCWAVPGGGITVISQTAGQYQSAQPSPDASRIAVMLLNASSESDVWIYSVAQGTFSRLSNVKTVASLAWTPDGQNILYVATVGNGNILFMQPASGGVPAKPVVQIPAQADGIAMAPDGREALLTISPSTFWQLARVSLDSGTLSPYLSSNYNLHDAQFSPDGKWVALVSDESGQDEVYLRSYPDPSAKLQISNGGGSEPKWSRDGSRLYYISGSALLSARLAEQPAMTLLGRDTVIASLPVSSQIGYFNSRYAPGQDGKRFLVSVPIRDEYQLMISPNWITEFRRKIAESGGK